MLRAIRHPLLVLLCAGALALTACGTTDLPADEGALGDGIGVKGSWTIDVRDVDGTLAESVDFTNDLLTSGHLDLARLLVGEASQSQWIVTAAGDPGPCGTGAADVTCAMYETSSSQGNEDAGRFTTLEVARVDSSVRLSGSFTAARDTALDRVESVLTTCTSEGACETGAFTGTTIAPVDVAAGQIVQVTVELSFGTLPSA